MALDNAMGAIEDTREFSGEFCDQLIGADRLWQRACHQAVQEGNNGWLERYLVDTRASTWPLDLLAANHPRYEAKARSIARCASLALHLRSVNGTDESMPTKLATELYQAAVEWQQLLSSTYTLPELDMDLLSNLSNALSLATYPEQQVQ